MIPFIAIGVLVLLNGCFVAAEFALVRSRRTRVEALQRTKPHARAFKTLLHQLDNLSEYLSSCQFGITLASLGIGFIGEPTLAGAAEPLIGNVFAHGIATVLAVTFAYLAVTVAHVTAGEQVPKMMAIVHPEKIALYLAFPLHIFTIMMGPGIRVLNWLSLAVLRLLKIRDIHLQEDTNSEDVRALIAQAKAGGKLDSGEAGMLSGVFHLHEQQARQIMTPAPALVMIDVNQSVEAALRAAVEAGHSRLVVIEDGDRDKVKGSVHVSALAAKLLQHGSDAQIHSLVRDVPIVPETKSLDDVLTDLQRLRSSLAVVVDEYGRVVGLVTVEDIVEEVVGEIHDETDTTAKDIRVLANSDLLVRGHTPIADLAEYGVELPEDSDAYTSVGGLVFHTLGRLANQGDVVHITGTALRVESIEGNRIQTVRIRRGRS